MYILTWRALVFDLQILTELVDTRTRMHVGLHDGTNTGVEPNARRPVVDLNTTNTRQLLKRVISTVKSNCNLIILRPLNNS